MGKVIKINMLALLSLVLCFAVYAEDAEKSEPDKLNNDISYFFGYAFGNNLLQGGNKEVDFDNIKRGLEDAMGGRNPRLTEEDQKAVVAEIQSRQKKVQEMAQQQGLDAAREYLANSATNEGVTVTESGLQYKVLVEGTGKKPTASNTVKVHYEGTLITGQVFDSSIKRGEPVEFQLNRVIPGWTEGLQLMQEGAKFKFVIPPELGYGAGGTGGIPPNSVLIFEVELLEVK
jgi:FKBP-type peptidyl-prolyl cis-trans isomerase FkpA